MSGRFSVAGAGPVSSDPGLTVLSVAANTTHRVHVYDWLFGTSAAADDNTIINKLERFTATPTGSAATPVALDLAEPASISPCVQAGTTGTISGVLLAIPTNQRASHRWVAAPDGELVIPATAASGIAYRAVHASFSSNMYSTFHFLE